jgi:uncharacterized phiE125 gp8 family phage protein
MSTVIVITPPSETLVTLAEAKAHLRVDHDDDNVRIQDLIWGAQNEFDGTDGTLQRAVGVQTLELRHPAFPLCEDIELSCPPLLLDAEHPLSVKYIDGDGAEQTVDPAVYAVVTTGLAGRARVALAYNQTWPAARWQADAVRVRYSAGYPADDKRAEGIKSAIKLHVEMIYDGIDEEKARKTITALLRPYQVY